MKKILNHKRLILGSQSPRRKQLLEELDLPFIQRVSDVDEVFDPEMPVEEVAEYLANLKANALRETLLENDVILTADSVVICDGEFLGKPVDNEEAISFINKLSDNEHTVITGICIMDTSKSESYSESSIVKIGPLTDEEIAYYIENYQPMDKAGAYGIQEWFGHSHIEWIKGTYTNIMGLPTKLVYEKLRKFCL
mgnify:CR=1 FL=1